MALPPKGGHIVRLVRREHSGPEVVYSQLSLAMAAAVRGLSPVSMTAFFTPKPRRAESTSFASSRRGSEMQSTAESTPSMARYN